MMYELNMEPKHPVRRGGKSRRRAAGEEATGMRKLSIVSH
jgi:hypothetical protein